MPEIVIPDTYADQVPSFVVPKLPEELSNDKKEPAEKKEAVPATATEGADKEQAAPDKDTGSPPAKSPSKGEQQRMFRAIRKAAEATARAEMYAKENAELKAKQQAPSQDPAAPKMESFTDIEEYAKAKADYEVKKADKERVEKENNQRFETSKQKLVSDWAEKEAEAEDKYDDYAEMVGEITPTQPWSIAMMEAENGADIAYYLGKHIKEAQRIASLPPVSQIREIGKLESKLSSTPAAPKQPSKAPPPITPVTGSAAVSDNEIKPQMPYEEYMKVRGKTFPRGI